MLNINMIDISATMAKLVKETDLDLTETNELVFVFGLEYASILYTTNYTVYNDNDSLQEDVEVYYTDFRGDKQSDITDVDGEASLDNFREEEVYKVNFDHNGEITRIEQVYYNEDLTDSGVDMTVDLLSSGSYQDKDEPIDLEFESFNIEYEEVS